MAETKADLEAKLAERDQEVADLNAQLDLAREQAEHAKAEAEDAHAAAGGGSPNRVAELEAENARLKAQLDEVKAAAGQPATAAASPDGGPISVDLPASRVPFGADPFNPERPEVGQYVGHGATSIASSYGQFEVDPETGLVVGPVGKGDA